MRRRQLKAPNQRWLPQHFARLREMLDAGLETWQIAERLGRSQGAVRQGIVRLKAKEAADAQARD